MVTGKELALIVPAVACAVRVHQGDLVNNASHFRFLEGGPWEDDRQKKEGQANEREILVTINSTIFSTERA